MIGMHSTARPFGSIAVGLAVLGLSSLLPAQAQAQAQAFKCPAPQDQQGPGVLKETAVQISRTADLLASGDEVNRVPEIVDGLRKRHPDVRNVELVNYLLTAYCPVVARMSGLGDAEKMSRLNRFASQASQVIYQR